jgi:hypothetical protein
LGISTAQPKVMVILGGELRSEKIRLLDELISTVDCIAVVGELAVAFLNLNQADYACYTLPCRQLLSKARLCGCTLLLPTDFVVGEDRPALEAAKRKCYDEPSPDSRADGLDYEGETKVYTTQALIDSVGGYRGKIYDIGPETVTSITTAATERDLIYVHGLAGVVEINSFQAGHIALAKALCPQPVAYDSKDPSTFTTTSKVILWGKATVDWFGRILDGDADFEGDLVASGHALYQHRDASLWMSIIGQQPSRLLAQTIKHRPAQDGEFIYSRRRPVEEEQEEEEDEEEEEEEDD